MWDLLPHISDRIDMKVCWKYTPAMGESGPAPRHVAEAKLAVHGCTALQTGPRFCLPQVGTLSMLDPNAMSECLVSAELSTVPKFRPAL